MRNLALFALLATGVAVNAAVIYNEGFETLADGTVLTTYNPGVGTAAPWQANVNVKATTAQAHTGTIGIVRDYSVNTTGTGGDIWKVLNFSPGSDVVVQTVWYKFGQNVTTLSTNQLLRTSIRSYAWNQADDSNPFIGAVALWSWQDVVGDDTTRGRAYLGIPTTVTGYQHFAPNYRATYASMTGWSKVEFVCDYRTGVYSAKIDGRDIGISFAWNNASNPTAIFPLPDHGMFTVQPLRFLDSGAGFVADANATDHSPFFDDYKVETKTAKPINGVVDHEAIVGYAIEGKAQDVIVTIMDSSGNVLEEGTTPCDATGAYSFSSTLPDGTYKVQVKSYKWLSNSASGVSVSAAGVNIGTLLLKGGDANEDNLIDVADYGILAAAFDGLQNDGTGVPTPNWSYNADFNCDGLIDVADYGLLAANFDGVGS